MNDKLRNDILQALHDKGYAFEFRELKKELHDKFKHERVVDNHVDVFSSQVMHLLNVLHGEGLVHRQVGGTGNMGMSTFYSLTASGYALFQPKHKRALAYFRRNIETVVISTVVTALVTFLLRYAGI